MPARLKAESSHGETQPSTSTLLLCPKTHGRAAEEDWRGGRGTPRAAGPDEGQKRSLLPLLLLPSHRLMWKIRPPSKAS